MPTPLPPRALVLLSTLLTIAGMFSAEGEEVSLARSVNPGDCQNAVELWLLEVEKVMQISIKTEIQASMEAYVQKVREVWILEWPGQVVLCVSQLYWTQDVEEALTQVWTAPLATAAVPSSDPPLPISRRETPPRLGLGPVEWSSRPLHERTCPGEVALDALIPKILFSFFAEFMVRVNSGG